MKQRSPLPSNSIIVVKVGTSILTGKNNRIDPAKVKKIAQDIITLKKKNYRVILVSSGAIGAGMGIFNSSKRPTLLPELQATAAIGQVHLINLYNKFFTPLGYNAAQLLLTRDDFHDRKRYLNARNTLFCLLNNSSIPIINENDTIAVDELTFGDNDTLSSLVATLIGAEIHIILSDIEGIYETKNGKKTKTIIQEVPQIDAELLSHVVDAKKEICVGGMATKIQAAKDSTHAGIPVVIAAGMSKDVLLKISKGELVGTFFFAPKKQLSSRKRWIAFTSKVKGTITVDDGASDAIFKKGRSLLASGIIEVEGVFSQGDAITVVDAKANEIARGLTNYSSSDISIIKGAKTSGIKKLLGYKYYDEVIHRNNMVLMKRENS